MTNPSLNILQDPAARRAFTMHDRVWHTNRYVYPVVSRRSKGISIGVNLNPDKICNFDCIYCSVDRSASAIPNPSADVDLPLLAEELRAMLAIVRSGEIYTADPFDKIPHELRRINDIAFSGDGEPTTFPQFPQVIQLAADIKTAAALPEVKLVLISNATMFHRPQVQKGLALLDANNGEIWAKLDAGTAEYYDLVDRTSVPFSRVLENILAAAQARPIVIQSLFMKVHGEPPSHTEFKAFIARLSHILSQGGHIKLVQLYTVARRTTEAFATPLSEAELSAFAACLHAALPQIPVEILIVDAGMDASDLLNRTLFGGTAMDEAAYHVAIREDPDDLAPRLAYAHWLDTNGQPDRAEWIRASIDYPNYVVSDPRWRPALDRMNAAFDRCRPPWWDYLTNIRQKNDRGIHRFILGDVSSARGPTPVKRLAKVEWLSEAFHTGWLDRIEIQWSDTALAILLAKIKGPMAEVPTFVCPAPQIEDEGLRILLNLPQLFALDLVGYAQRNPAALELATCANLRELTLGLHFDDAPSIDAIIEQILSLPHLRRLVLVGHKLPDGTSRPNDTDLLRLQNAPALRRLFLSSPAVSTEAIEELRHLCPSLSIVTKP